MVETLGDRMSGEQKESLSALPSFSTLLYFSSTMCGRESGRSDPGGVSHVFTASEWRKSLSKEKPWGRRHGLLTAYHSLNIVSGIHLIRVQRSVNHGGGGVLRGLVGAYEWYQQQGAGAWEKAYLR